MHVIRLRRPWEKSCGGGTDWIRIDVPEEVSEAPADDVTAVVLYRRGFHLPSGLKPSSRVRLRVDGWEGKLESIAVNGAPLGTGIAAIDTDITELLEPGNRILMCLSGSGGRPARLSGEVSLAIEEAADAE